MKWFSHFEIFSKLVNENGRGIKCTEIICVYEVVFIYLYVFLFISYVLEIKEVFRGIATRVVLKLFMLFKFATFENVLDLPLLFTLEITYPQNMKPV